MQNTQETDLRSMIYSFWQQKWLILIITFICASLGTFFALTHTPVYQAKATLIPPHEVGAFNPPLFKLSKFTPQKIYDIFLFHLSSEFVKRDFFNHFFLPSLPKSIVEHSKRDLLYKNFLKTLTINPSPLNTTIAFKGKKPAQARQWIKEYIELARTQAINEILQILRQQSQSSSLALQSQIELEVSIAKDLREDRVLLLKEALQIAKAVQDTTPTFKPTIDGAVLKNPNFLYLQGTAYIQSELDNISKRKSDESFVPNIRRMQEKYQYFKNLNFDSTTGKVFLLDSHVYTPDLPLPPSKTTIFLIFCLVGLMLSLGVAFIRYLFGQQKNQIA